MLIGKSLPVSIKPAVADSVTATAATVSVLRDCAARPTDVVTLASKVIRVTRGTVGRECRIGPVHGLRVVTVAGRAQQDCTVIQRFVAQADVPEVVRHPGDGVVAFAAFPGRDEVTLELAGCRDAIVAG